MDVDSPYVQNAKYTSTVEMLASQIMIHHMGSKICCEMKAKHDNKGNKKISSILSFFTQGGKCI